MEKQKGIVDVRQLAKNNLLGLHTIFIRFSHYKSSLCCPLLRWRNGFNYAKYWIEKCAGNSGGYKGVIR